MMLTSGNLMDFFQQSHVAKNDRCTPVVSVVAAVVVAVVCLLLVVVAGVVVAVGCWLIDVVLVVEMMLVMFWRKFEEDWMITVSMR
jgi:hypothetical protein